MKRSDFTAFSTDSRRERRPPKSRASSGRSSARSSARSSDRSGGGDSRSSARSARSARARGLRTLQHQSLPAATRFAIDTEVWLRSLVLEGWGDGEAPPHARWATKDQVHDEALAWFLEQQVGRKLGPPARPSGPGEDLTFWLDSRLLERARQLAHRSGMRLAHLIEMALGAYVGVHVPAKLLAFRHRVQLEAQRLHRQRMTAAPRSRARVAQRAPIKLRSTAPTRSRR